MENGPRRRHGLPYSALLDPVKCSNHNHFRERHSTSVPSLVLQLPSPV